MHSQTDHGPIIWSALVVIGVVAGCVVAGCTSGLPDVRTNVFADVKMSASPVFHWYGSRTGLKTYWGDQDVSISVAAAVPETCSRPQDAQWDVKARNAEGKPLPFIGVLYHYQNENGTKLAMLVSPGDGPPANISTLPDCLYVMIDPNIESENGKVKSIRPMAFIREIRRHTIMPFIVSVPLMPENDTPLTPRPAPLPFVPSGTPVKAD